MWKAYKYLFYKFYKWAFNLHGEIDSPAYTAMLTISALTFLYFLGFIMFFEYLTKIIIIPFIATFKIQIIIGYALWGVINYFFFIYKRKYKKIEKEFENEKNKTLGTILVWVYIIGSFVFMISSAILASNT